MEEKKKQHCLVEDGGFNDPGLVEQVEKKMRKNTNEKIKVGSWFHSFEDGGIFGQVVAEKDGYYFIKVNQYYEGGEKNTVYHITDINNIENGEWTFFDTREDVLNYIQKKHEHNKILEKNKNGIIREFLMDAEKRNVKFILPISNDVNLQLTGKEFMSFVEMSTEEYLKEYKPILLNEYSDIPF